MFVIGPSETFGVAEALDAPFLADLSRRTHSNAADLGIDNMNALFCFWQRQIARLTLALGITWLAFAAQAQTTFNVTAAGNSTRGAASSNAASNASTDGKT